MKIKLLKLFANKFFCIASVFGDFSANQIGANQVTKSFKAIKIGQ